MATGYLVSLGDGSLDAGDAISGTPATFTIDRTLGNGQWTWTGIWAQTGRMLTNDTPDGVVDGTRGIDVIDTAFVDPDNESVGDGAGNDIVAAGAGNDTVTTGDGADTLFGGVGNDADVVYGGAGDMTVTVDITDDGNSTAQEVSTSTQDTDGGPFGTNSALLVGGEAGPTSTTTISFEANLGTGLTDSVENVSFRINDIDTAGWQDIVTINAFDADGNPVTITLTPAITGTATSDTVSGNTITAGDQADSASDAAGSVLVEIAGPVQSIEIIYSNGGTVGPLLWVADVNFDTVAIDTADHGNDTIDGGAGGDVISGASTAPTADRSQGDAGQLFLDVAKIERGSETGTPGDAQEGDSVIFNNAGAGEEFVSFSGNDVTSFTVASGTSISPNVSGGQVTGTGTGTEGDNAADQDAWFDVSFEDLSGLTMTVGVVEYGGAGDEAGGHAPAWWACDTDQRHQRHVYR